MNFVLTIVVLVLRNVLRSDYFDRPDENSLKRNVVDDATTRAEVIISQVNWV